MIAFNVVVPEIDREVDALTTLTVAAPARFTTSPLTSAGHLVNRANNISVLAAVTVIFESVAIWSDAPVTTPAALL